METIQLNDRVQLIAIMNKYLILLFIILCGIVPSTGNCKNNSIPSNDTIIKWWNNDPDNYYGDLASKNIYTRTAKKIFLRNKETAFLIEVSLPDRGDDSDSVIMVRPAKKQAREIKQLSGKKDIEQVYDLDHDGVSDVVFSSYSGAYGETGSSYSIVEFVNWNPIILHQIEFFENSGCCGGEKSCRYECHYEDVSWKFVDLDGDGVDDLVEEMTTKQGPSEDKLTETKTTTYYLFKNKKFIKVDDSSKLHLP
jgi:hypothetical protein